MDFIETHEQESDIMTKLLAQIFFEYLHKQIMV